MQWYNYISHLSSLSNVNIWSVERVWTLFLQSMKTLWCPPWFYLNNFTKWPSVYEIQYFNWFTIKSVDALSVNPTKWSNTLKQFRRIVWVCLIILRDWRKMIKRIKGLLLQNSLIFFLKTVQNNELMNYEF